ncbi:hypothetical protein V2G26_007464 [Clonostachys chloroleuca]
MYNAFNKCAAKFVDSLWSETMALSVEAKHASSPLNMAAVVIVSLSLMSQGRDYVVMEYAERAVQMGEELNLFGTAIESAHDKDGPSGLAMRVHSYAALGVFGWSVFLALFFRKPGFQFPSHPPSLPIPGSPLFEQAGATNEDGTDTPREENLMGSVFTSLCHFWSLVHNGLWIYYADRPNAPPRHWSINSPRTSIARLLPGGLTKSH